MKHPHRIRTGMAAGLVAMLFVFTADTFGAAGLTEPDPGGGIGGTGITGFGVVQRFGSIFVNGREYLLNSGTHITRDGRVSDVRALRLGQVVAVQGRVDRPGGRSVADSVVIRIVLQGRIDTIDRAGGSFSILGQTVRVSVATFGGASAGDHLELSKLSPGQVVTVSGLRRADGTWIATRVALVTDTTSGQFLVLGSVSAVDHVRGKLDIDAHTFTVGRGLIAGTVPGDRVIVTGQYRHGSPVVTDVRRDFMSLGKAGGQVEMSGYVQRRPAPGQLVSNGVILRYSPDAVMIGGTVANLKPGLPIVVRGGLQVDGSIAVREIILNIDPMDVTMPERVPTASGTSSGKLETERDGQRSTESNGRVPLPEVERPEIEKPEIERPEIEKPEIEYPDTSVPQMGR